jgi:nucleolar GTP-binding protein
MNYQKIPAVEPFQFYIDLGFKKTKKQTTQVKRISAFADGISSRFIKIIDLFPSFDQFSDFERELTNQLFSISETRKALGKLDSAKRKLKLLAKSYSTSINNHLKKTRPTKSFSDKQANKLLKEFYGRAASIVRQLKKELIFLEEIRKELRDFPFIRDVFTVCIAGFPNVGKSTLLRKISTSKPEIQNYGFTTKSLNVGYTDNKKQVQLIDTPGSLNRGKMNKIEKQADLALEHIANLIIYVIDPTEPYPMKKQKQLLLNLKKYNKKIIVYQSKADLVGDKKLFNAITDPEVLKEMIKPQ